MMNKKQDNGKIGLTIISGLQGAGKTSLIQNILANEENLKCAIIVNDINEVSIDANLIQNDIDLIDNTSIISLKNGCYLCNFKNFLIREIIQIIKYGLINSIVMESKGIREPMQLAETFSLDQDEIDRNIPEALLELKEMVQLNTLINVVDCSSFFKYFNSREIASDVFDDVDAADERSIFNLLVDQIEFSNILLLNKCDLVSQEEKEQVINTLQLFNLKVEIFETVQSQIDIKQILYSQNFNYELADQNIKGLYQENLYENMQTLQNGYSCFTYKRQRPFHPNRIYELLNNNFMVDIINPNDDEENESDSNHSLDKDVEMNDEDYQEENDENETDSQYFKRLQKAKDKYKQELEQAFQLNQQGIFKNIFRIKGCIWLANRPQLFYQFSQVSSQLNVTVGGPWVCTLEQGDQFNGEIGDRVVNLVIIGSNLIDSQKQITEQLDNCLVTQSEWQEMFSNQLLLEVKDDPFKEKQ